jgi:ABC-type uncharacterized transport system involved in gliding motility auxiliary subunit/ABC-type transport system involved in multi-copper enzyme maturation permease subunit
VKSFYILLKRELSAYLRTPIAYVFIIAFNLVAMIDVFFISSFLRTNQADLNLFFSHLPWLLLALVPGIGMRLWSEERSKGTIELLLTQPIKIWHAVTAKFLAGSLVIALALASTLPLVATLYYLGSPDKGPLITGYLGGFLMAASFLAICSYCSAVTKSQTSSFVLSIIFLLCLILVGWGFFGDILASFLPLSLVEGIANLGALSYFERLAKGVISTRDIAYFMAVICFTLGLTGYQITRHISSKPLLHLNIRHQATQLFALYFSIACLLSIVSIYDFRYDATEQKLYTVSEKSIDIASRLKKPLEIKLYFSRSLPNMPAFIKQYASRVGSILKQFQAKSNGLISLQIIDPKPDTKMEDDAITEGIKGIGVKDGSMYFGISFTSGNAIKALAYVDPAEESEIEYEITQKIVSFSNPEKPRLGILSSLDLQKEILQTDLSGKIEKKTKRWQVLEELSERYKVTLLERDILRVDPSFDVLLVIHPKNLSSPTENAIEKFVSQGGRVIFLLDPFSRTELRQKHGVSMLSAGGGFESFSSNFAPLKRWGIGFNSSKVVGDDELATYITTGSSRIHYPAFIKTTEQNITPANINNGISDLLFAEPGYVELLENTDTTMTALVSTSQNAGIISHFSLAYQDANTVSTRFRQETMSDKKILAALFKGVFKSQTQANSFTFKQQTNLETKLIVIADVDFIADANAITRGQGSGRFKNHNINFLINSIDYLSNKKDSQLSQIKASGILARPFTTMRSFHDEAKKTWNEQEARLQKKLNINNEILSGYYTYQKQNNIFNLSAKQLLEVKALREYKDTAETRLRRMKAQFTGLVERIHKIIITLNLLAAPLFVGIFGFIYFIRRFQKTEHILLRPQLILFAGSALTATLIIAISIVSYNSKDKLAHQSADLKAKSLLRPLFAIEKLASLEKVVLTNEGQVLNFIKTSNGGWVLLEKDKSPQPINADRLAVFLYSLAEAKIVRTIEAKGNEDLKSLGLYETSKYPENGSSIRLISSKGRPILELYVGNRREGSGAFVRLGENQNIVLIDQIPSVKTTKLFWLYAGQG